MARAVHECRVLRDAFASSVGKIPANPLFRDYSALLHGVRGFCDYVSTTRSSLKEARDVIGRAYESSVHLVCSHQTSHRPSSPVLKKSQPPCRGIAWELFFKTNWLKCCQSVSSQWLMITREGVWPAGVSTSLKCLIYRSSERLAHEVGWPSGVTVYEKRVWMVRETYGGRRLDDCEWETDRLSKFRCGGGGESLATLTPRVVRARERRWETLVTRQIAWRSSWHECGAQ